MQQLHGCSITWQQSINRVTVALISWLCGGLGFWWHCGTRSSAPRRILLQASRRWCCRRGDGEGRSRRRRCAARLAGRNWTHDVKEYHFEKGPN